MGEDDGMVFSLVVRDFDPIKDCEMVQDVERRCEVGPSGGLSLFTDLLGDPICRVRHSPAYLMLVCVNKLTTATYFISFFSSQKINKYLV